ncbi:3069_t:CDS:1 [Gigaspora margarita]|uniref:3069_t:CDS:1 n=1 Tax=Gigaspora margarita TaxID=4874 RepID=A0ABN7VR56_GIGMA|nr:3069_t:CDS:1 [Gigaspora margarita]
MKIDKALQNKRERLYDKTSSKSEEETSTTNTSNSLSSTNSRSSTNTFNSQSSTNTSNLQSSTNKNKKRTKHFYEVWDYFRRGSQKSNGYYKATCYYCNMSWLRGKPAKLEAHLANKYDHCPNDISQYWREKLAEKTSNYT